MSGVGMMSWLSEVEPGLDQPRVSGVAIIASSWASASSERVQGRARRCPCEEH